MDSPSAKGDHVEVVVAHVEVLVCCLHVATGVTLRSSGVLDRPSGDQELEPGVTVLLVKLLYLGVHVGGRVGVQPLHEDVHRAGDTVDAAQTVAQGLLGRGMFLPARWGKRFASGCGPSFPLAIDTVKLNNLYRK